MKRSTAIATFALVVSLVAARPAYAAESADCIRQNVAPAVLTGFEDRIAAGLIAKDEAALKQDWSTLRAALDICRAKYKWSEKAASLATQLTLTSIMKGAVQRTLVADRMDPVLLTKIYADLPLDVRRQFLDPATLTAASTVFAQRMAARNIMMTEGKVNEHIGMLLAALALLEFRPAEFAAA